MKPYLLRLSCGRLSLEFKDDDRRALTAAIRERFGRPEIEVYPGASICRFGGESFTFYDQWGEPCLTSSSTRGDELLIALARDLAPENAVPIETGREQAAGPAVPGAATEDGELLS